jgi:hypothetical protein
MREASLARGRQFSTDAVVPQYESYYARVMAR